MSFEDFSRDVRMHKPRVTKVRDSYGVRDYFSYYRKVKPSDRGSALKESDYQKIIRGVDGKICDALRNSDIIQLPFDMGMLLGEKRIPEVKYVDGKLKNTYPVDFNATLKLWYEDEESRRRKTLVRFTGKETVRLRWDNRNSKLRNKGFFLLKFNRVLKTSIHRLHNNGRYDTYLSEQ